MRRLPAWLADGPEVSDLAYRVVAEAWGDPVQLPTTPPLAAERLSLVELVERLAIRLAVDEADVLRSFAELERVGVLSTDRKGGP